MDFLQTCSEGQVTLTFEQVEAILGQPLPDSARKYDFWWRGSPQTRARWKAVGWTLSCSMAAETVTFTRVP
jgi:hypothetical protein